MINEKELRTGNIYTTIRNQEIIVRGINTIDKFVLVDGVDSAETANKSNSIIFEDLNPVEISTLKSERFGFSPETKEIVVLSDNGARFLWDEQSMTIVFKDGQDGLVGQTIRYVHQFQNLYYFLTGKELVV